MRYLLGTLSQEERAQLEERYFSDDKEFEEIEIAEDELIDRYIRGELTDTERKGIAELVARSPRLRERIEFAKLFADKLRVAEAPASAVKTKWWEGLFGFATVGRGPQLAVGFSMVLVVVAVGVLLIGWWQLRQQSLRLAAQQAALEQRRRELDKQAAELKAQIDELARRGQPTPSETPVPPPVQEPTPQTGAVLAFTLSPGTTRSASGASQIRISPGTNELRLALNLRGTDYSSYRVTINSVDRKNIFSKAGLKPQASKLTFRVAAQLLPQGDYYVSLFGEPANESVDDYPFRVIKQ